MNSSTQPNDLEKVIVEALEELKAVDVRVLDVRKMSSFTDHMVIASGTSNRHVKSIADNVIRRAKEIGVSPIGSEGERIAEWILVDLGDVVVHVMLPEIRDFYNLEKLWSVDQPQAQDQS